LRKCKEDYAADDGRGACEPADTDRLLQEDPREHDRDHDARLAHGGDRRRAREPQREQDEKVRRGGGDPDRGRNRSCRRSEASPADREGICDCRAEHHEQQVGRRVGVPDPVTVDDRIARDRGSDHDGQPRPARTAPGSPDEQDPDRDRGDSADLAARGARTDHDHDDYEREHGCEPTRERIDEAELKPPVGGGEQRDVGELEAARGDEVRHRRALDPPRRNRQRRQRDHEDDERNGHDRLGVSFSCEQEVPERVEPRGRQRKAESLSAQWWPAWSSATASGSVAPT
jgi:hypothetical protein